MYRLLVVDDEPLIADSLAELFAENDEYCFEVRKAYSSSKALAILEDINVDIVITDICMPGLSGLELHDKIKQNWPGTKVVFLSGHDDFEYAQAAVRKDGVDFVLKTEGDEQIFAAVGKAVQSIEEQRKQEQTLKDVKKQIKKALPFLQQDYLSRLIQGIRSSESERRTIFEEYEIPLRYNEPCFLLFGYISRPQKHQGYSENMQTSFGIQKILNRYLKPYYKTFFVSMGLNKHLWFLQYAAAGSGGIQGDPVQFLNRTLEMVQESVQKIYDIPFSFAVTGNPVLWDEVSKTYDLLELMFKQHSGVDRIIITVNRNKTDARENSPVQESEQEVLSQLKKMPFIQEYLESGQEEEFAELFGELRRSVVACRPVSPEVSEQVCYSLGLAFTACINRSRMVGDLPMDPGFEMRFIHEKMNEMNWDERFDYFLKVANLIFSQKNDSTARRSSRTIKIVHDYIEKHLGEDISMVRLADVVNLNPSYLSRLYKQNTGMSLSDYICKRKVDRAAELLSRTSMKITEIARELGFSSGSYFSRFYKKYTKLSPEEYREASV
jgi:two-component system response regulator YesN